MAGRHLVGRGAVPALSAALLSAVVLAACSSSGSTGVKAGTASSGSTPALPAVGTSPTAIHLYSEDTGDDDGFFGPDGKAITDQNAAPKVGDYFVSANHDFLGDHTHHGSAVVATDHIVCVFVTVSASGGTDKCDAEIVSGGSMMYADQQNVAFTDNTQGITLTITGGTGRFAGAHGTVATTDVGNSNSNISKSDVTLTVSAPAGGTAPTAAPPTLSATPTTIKYFSRSVVDAQFGPDGKAMTDPNASPAIGGYFVSADVNYVGNHTRHDKAAASTDHLVCVILSFNGQTSLSAKCDGEFAIGNSLIVADQAPLELSQATSSVTLSFTGGTGSYRGAHGTIRSDELSSNSNDSDIVLTLSK